MLTLQSSSISGHFGQDYLKVRQRQMMSMLDGLNCVGNLTVHENLDPNVKVGQSHSKVSKYHTWRKYLKILRNSRFSLPSFPVFSKDLMNCKNIESESFDSQMLTSAEYIFIYSTCFE